MKVVYKYPVNIMRESTPICVHEGYKVVLCEMQKNTPCLWFEMDIRKPQERFSVIVIATGQRVPDNYAHLGSMQDGPYVWHLYRKTE